MFSLDEDLLDLETVIAELPDGPLSLFAYSCAGPLAVTYAVRHPERVTHLILYGTFKHGGGLGTVPVQRSIADVVRASWGSVRGSSPNCSFPARAERSTGAVGSSGYNTRARLRPQPPACSKRCTPWT